MAITYPRDLPDVPFEASRLALNVNQSSFGSAISRKIQIQQHAAGVTDRWEGLFTTPRLSAAQHAELTAWLVSLRGREGTFLAGDPDRKLARSGAAGQLMPANSLESVNSTAGTFNALYVKKPLYLLGLKPGSVISSIAGLRSTTGADDIFIRIETHDIDGNFLGSQNGNTVNSATDAASAFTNYTILPDVYSITWFVQNNTTSETAFCQDAKMNRGPTNNARFGSVKGASQTGRTLLVDRIGPADTKNIFLVGDYFMLEAVSHGSCRITRPVKRPFAKMRR